MLCLQKVLFQPSEELNNCWPCNAPKEFNRRYLNFRGICRRCRPTKEFNHPCPISTRIKLSLSYRQKNSTIVVLPSKEINHRRINHRRPNSKDSNHHCLSSKRIQLSLTTTPKGSTIVISSSKKEFNHCCPQELSQHCPNSKRTQPLLSKKIQLYIANKVISLISGEIEVYRT